MHFSMRMKIKRKIKKKSGYKDHVGLVCLIKMMVKGNEWKTIFRIGTSWTPLGHRVAELRGQTPRRNGSKNRESYTCTDVCHHRCNSKAMCKKNV